MDYDTDKMFLGNPVWTVIIRFKVFRKNAYATKTKTKCEIYFTRKNNKYLI